MSPPLCERDRRRGRAQLVAATSAEGRTYGMPGLVYRGRPLLSVRQTGEHLGYFPFSAEVVDSVASELEGYSLSKGTVRFSVEQPLPPASSTASILPTAMDRRCPRPRPPYWLSSSTPGCVDS